MIKQSKDVNIPFHRFSGVYGKELSNIDKENLLTQNYITKKYLTTRTQGELGCNISHLQVFDQCKKDNKHYIIFEDDAILNKDFNHSLQLFLKHLPNDWDMFYLYINNFYLNDDQVKEQKQRKKINEHISIPISPIGMVAYGINNHKINKIIKLVKPLHDKAIDNMFSYLIDNHKIKVYSTSKNIISHPKEYYSNTKERMMKRKIIKM